MKSFTAKPKILVLGGTGFLGTNLVKALLEKNFMVRVFCRSSKKMKIKNKNLEIYEGDFITGIGLEEALRGMEVVYHLISTTIPSTSNSDLVKDVQTNLVGSLTLFQKMQKMKIKRILYMSSGGTVYGNPYILPVPEYHLLSPLCSYGIVKVAIENYLNLFSKIYDFKTTILRLSNPYGIHQTSIGIQGLITTVFKKIINGEEIEIWGDGSVVRDFIYITDVVDAMINALMIGKSGTFNIGSGKGHSILEVIDVISNLIGEKPNLTYLPSRPFDVNKIFLDIYKASDELGWKPHTSLTQGCKNYSEYFKT